MNKSEWQKAQGLDDEDMRKVEKLYNHGKPDRIYNEPWSVSYPKYIENSVYGGRK